MDEPSERVIYLERSSVTSDFASIRGKRIGYVAEFGKSAGRPVTDVRMLRIDELAELGSCCFCSIWYIVTKPVLARSPKKARAFMRAVHRAAEFLQREPAKARHEYNS